MTKLIRRLRREPVAIGAVVSAGLALAEAVQHHALTEGVITSVIISVLGLFVRGKVTPTN